MPFITGFASGGNGQAPAVLSAASVTPTYFTSSGTRYNLWTYTTAYTATPPTTSASPPASSSGTFTIVSPGLADMLLLAGGGGGCGQNGGSSAAGNGGAGGLLQLYSLYLDVGTYNVYVGPGGAGGSTSAARGGDTWVINSTTGRIIDEAWGGGAGGYSYNESPLLNWRGFPGGSGGGCGDGAGAPGAGVPGQGHDASDYYGGGAGGVGSSTGSPLTVTNWSADGSHNAVSLSLGAGGHRTNVASPANVGAGGSAWVGSSGNGWAGGSGLFILRTKS